VSGDRIDDAAGERFARFFADASRRLRALPGVKAAGAITRMPLEGGSDRIFEIEGRVGEETHDAHTRHVTPGWFDAMSIPLLRGRAFTDGDDANAEPVAIVSQAFSRAYFRDGDPIGKRIRLGALGDKTFPWTRIVGVVGDVSHLTLDEPPVPTMYWPTAQTRESAAMALVARTDGDPNALLSLARAAIAELDPTQPVYDLQPVTAMVDASVAQRRFTLVLLAVFAGVALVLAALGIYAVVAYDVAQRTSEIGIRVALGAQAIDVVRLVVRDGMTPVLLGIVVGTAGALALARVARSLLYGVSTTDLPTYAVIVVALAVVALAAILVPARRALRVDPMEVLRVE
jgi:putative ABC transport system permease protein